MAQPKEPPPTRSAKIRGGLPGESWREHVSAGAQRAYDYPLANQRKEAKALRRKGRLIQAHRTEKASYKIRTRGYDRKFRGEAPVAKALTSETRKFGPYAHKRLRLTFKQPSKWEKTNDTIRALGGGRTMLLVAGGGTAAAVANAKEQANRAKEIVTGRKPDTESKVVGKAWAKHDQAAVVPGDASMLQLNRATVARGRSKALKRPQYSTTYLPPKERIPAPGVRDHLINLPETRSKKHRKQMVKAYKKAKSGDEVYVEDVEYRVHKSLTIDDINDRHLPVLYRRMDIDTINKSVTDEEYWAYLEEIEKTVLGSAFNSLKGSQLGQLGHRYGQAAYRGYMNQGGVEGAQAAMKKVSQRTGGFEGARQAAQHTWQNASPGAKTALGVGGGVAGAGALGYGAYRMAKPLIKRKAKKAAMYGALGLGGAVAGGTALGNMASNR